MQISHAQKKHKFPSALPLTGRVLRGEDLQLAVTWVATATHIKASHINTFTVCVYESGELETKWCQSPLWRMKTLMLIRLLN